MKEKEVTKGKNVMKSCKNTELLTYVPQASQERKNDSERKG